MAPEALQQVEETTFRSKLSDTYIPKHLPLHSYCFENLPQVSTRPCLINGGTGEVYTYADVELTGRRIASGLNKVGVNQGEVIMLLLHNCAELVLAFLGASFRGAFATGANPFFTPAEISNQAKASKAKIIITQGCYVEKVKGFAEENNVKLMCVDSAPDGCLHFSELSNSDESDLPDVEINPDDVVALPHSSGTTEFPKGVMLTHKGLVTSVAQQVDGENPNLYFHSEDVILCVLPLFHIYALNSIMLCGLRVGVAILIMQKFEIGKFLELIQKHKVTIAPMVPPIVLAIAKSTDTNKYDLSSVQMMKSGAAPFGKELEDAVRTKFSGAKLGQHLQSPMSPAMTSPTAIFLILLLILVLFATAATAAAPWTSSSVEFSRKSVSDEAILKCRKEIPAGNCRNEKCCLPPCAKRIPGAKLEVGYTITNGTPLCLCQAIYNDKAARCPP